MASTSLDAVLNTEARRYKELCDELAKYSTRTSLGDHTEETILKHKFLKLKAEINVLKETSARAANETSNSNNSETASHFSTTNLPSKFMYPNNEDLQSNLRKRKLEEEISSLRDLLDFQLSVKTKMLEKKVKIERMIEEEINVFGFITCEYNRLNSLAPQDGNQTLKELIPKFKKLRSLKHEREEQLKQFLAKYFSNLDDDTMTEWYDADCSSPYSEKQPLSEIITKLICKYQKKDGDPWVKIDSTMVESGIQLLLFTGIAVRHPTKPSLIRLVEFDLLD